MITRRVGLYTIMLTSVANKPTLRLGHSTRVRSHEVLLCSCTAHHRSLESQIDQSCASVDLATRLSMYKKGLCPARSTCVANRPTLRIGRFATRAVTHSEVLCYYISSKGCKSIDTARPSICNMFVHA